MDLPVIDEIPAEAIEAELTPERFLRRTNKGGNELYVVNGRECPAVMREVGRLREIAFRAGGGGTGLDCDIDEFDLMDPPCSQLVVWDPDSRRILGGYRFIAGPDVRFDAPGVPRLATGHLFDFSPEFIRDYLPYTLELGRSFVRLDVQASGEGAAHGGKSIYVLDNLWDGLGALSVKIPGIKYFFGKVTMYPAPAYLAECRDMILHFFHKYFPDPDRLVTPKVPLDAATETPALDALFCGGSFREDYRILNKAVRERGLNIPPLVNAYMNLSPNMRCFGTAVNHEFGDVEETGIFLAIDDIFEEKKQRHIDSYLKSLPANE